MIARRRADTTPAEADERLPKGVEVAGYRIRRVLDRPIGSYVAYEATQGTRSRVAFKLLNARLSADDRFSSHLEDVIPRQVALSHPAMVPVLDGGRIEQGLYVVSSLVSQPTLTAVLDAAGRESEVGGLGPERAMHVLRQIAGALEVAHGAGLTHGCLQTRSIRLGPGDDVFVDDFGLGRLESSEDPYAGPAVMYGAPEQLNGEPPTALSDVYGLAAIAYECLTGALPYWHGALSHDGKPPLPMARHSRELPPELDAPFARGLAYEPDERPASVSELLEGLTDALVLYAEEPARDRNRDRDAREKERRRALQARGREEVPLDRERPAVWNDGAAPTRVGATAGRRRGLGRGENPNTRRNRVVALIGGVAVTAAVAAAVLAGRDSAEPPPVDVATTVRSGLLELTAPSGWKRVTPWDSAGLAFASKPVALAAPDGSDGPKLLAGPVEAQGPTFVPPAVAESLTEALPRPDVVTLGQVGALRYSGLRLRDREELLTLYSVPTSAGVALISCFVPASDGAVSGLASCERVAASAQIRGAEPVALTVSPEYGEALTAVLTRLNAVRARERENLRLRGRQPAAARSLALAYAEAGRTLADTEPPADAAMHENIRRAFRQTRQAYAALTTAARRNDRPAYGRARRAVDEGERQIQASLKALNVLGYAKP